MVKISITDTWRSKYIMINILSGFLYIILYLMGLG